MPQVQRKSPQEKPWRFDLGPRAWRRKRGGKKW
jgi:hypothetical protein